MPSLTGRQPVQKPDKAQRDPERLGTIHDGMPCCICAEFGLAQRSPTQAHHPIHERFGTRKRADATCIPLCEGHHQGMFDTSKVAVHRDPEEWKRLYGNDFEWTAWPDEWLRRNGFEQI